MTRHAKLMGIDLKHNYARSGWCTDFDVAAAPDTGIRLQNHRCVLKPRAGGADLYVEVDTAGKPLIPFAKGVELSFELLLRNPEFALYTDPAPLAEGPDYRLIYPAGRARCYLTVAVRRAFNQAAGPNLELAFPAKKLLWVYYVVTDRTGADSDFAIAPADPQLAWKLDNSSDELAAKLAQQYQGARVLRFVSGQLLPCREDGLAGMRLLYAGTQVMQNLPSPSWRNFYRAKMAATGQDVDAMMQIVKYLSNTSLTKV